MESLDARLTEFLEQSPGKYAAGTIGRVASMVSYVRVHPETANLPYRLFEKFDDFKLFYDLKSEWHGSVGTKFRAIPGANAFYDYCRKFLKERMAGKKKRREMLNYFLSVPKFDRTGYLLDDWKQEFAFWTDGFQCKTITEARHFAGDNFYQALRKWAYEQGTNERERTALVRIVLNPLKGERTLYNLTDWKEEFLYHTEWHGVSSFRICNELDGRAFYEGCRNWVNNTYSDEQKRKKVMRAVFKQKVE